MLTPSKNLLVFFALFMIVISILMLKGNREKKENEKKIDKKNARVIERICKKVKVKESIEFWNITKIIIIMKIN